MKITTRHGEIGYTCNLEVIERALRERFGVEDNSHVVVAVAAHIWSAVCGKGPEITWGTEEIATALRAIKYRTAQIEAQVARVDQTQGAGRVGNALTPLR